MIGLLRTATAETRYADPERPITVPDGLPVFLMGDQPQTCGQCGARTRIDAEWTRLEHPSGRLTADRIVCQHHACLNPRCAVQFIAEGEPDGSGLPEDEDDEDTCPHCGGAR